MTMPCLRYVGEADGLFEGARECVKHMRNVTFASFPGLDHGQTSQRSDLVLPHVQKFPTSVVLQATAAE